MTLLTRAIELRTLRRPRSPDRGSVTIETAMIVMPVVVVMIAFAVLCFRVAATNQDVTSAASAAARAASQAGSAQQAVDAAQHRAAADLADHHHTCQQLTVDTDTSAFGPGGQVAVTVTCRLATGDLVGLDLPGSVQGSSTAFAVVDTYRANEG
jgi:Flp pilus assembly protein TadG